MTKVLIIGDLLGSSKWKKIEDIGSILSLGKKIKPKYDYYVFLGNYISSADAYDNEAHNNLIDIFNFKKIYPNKVILLIGHNDMDFLLPNSYLKKYCTFRMNEETVKRGRKLYRKNQKKLQMAFQIGINLFTHSLIREEWWNNNFLPELKKEKPYKENYTNLADMLNTGWKHKLKSFYYSIIKYDPLRKLTEYTSILYSSCMFPERAPQGIRCFVGHNFNSKFKTFIIDDYTSVHCINSNKYEVSYKKIEI